MPNARRVSTARSNCTGTASSPMSTEPNSSSCCSSARRAAKLFIMISRSSSARRAVSASSTLARAMSAASSGATRTSAACASAHSRNLTSRASFIRPGLDPLNISGGTSERKGSTGPAGHCE
eukprot:scaffold43756_cov53-Phaeocystis_antarctica.AAC.2